MSCPRVVVIGASAGGLDAVTTVVRGLPEHFPASVFIVIHTGTGGGMLPRLIGRSTDLPVRVPTVAEPIAPGHIYLPPPDWHLLIEDSSVRASHGPTQHGFRPAVDPLFITAARSYGECAAGVILSGALSDGTAGLLAIKRAGGATIVQDPEEAPFSSMPLSALKSVEVDAVLSAGDIAPYLVELMIAHEENAGARAARPPTEDAASANDNRTTSNRRAGEAMDPRDTHLSPPAGHGDLTALTCPNCGGALWEVRENGVEQFECHVGHRFGSEALVALEDERTETILWAAVRALKEDAAVRRRVAARADALGLDDSAERWLNDARQAEARALRIRNLIERTEGLVETPARPRGARHKAKAAAQTPSPEARRRKRTRK